MKKNKIRPLIPLIIFFLAINALAISNLSFWSRIRMDKDVLLWGNLILFITTIVSYIFALRGLNATNPHRFVRGVYSSIMVKLFICLVAALVYILNTTKDTLNKPALFACMGLYLVYTFLEVRTLTKVLKEYEHA
jgi:hypothetical protein